MTDNQRASGIDKYSTVILIRPSGKMLLQLRDDGNGENIEYPRWWCFPGGSMEDEDGDHLDAIIREVKEEFEIDIIRSQCEFLVIYALDDKKTDHVFVCKIAETVSPRLQEGDGLRWVYFDDLRYIVLAWNQQFIIPALKEYIYEDRKNRN